MGQERTHYILDEIHFGRIHNFSLKKYRFQLRVGPARRALSNCFTVVYEAQINTATPIVLEFV